MLNNNIKFILLVIVMNGENNVMKYIYLDFKQDKRWCTSLFNTIEN